MKSASYLLLSLSLGLAMEGCSDTAATGSNEDQLGSGESAADAGSDHDHEEHEHDDDGHPGSDASCSNVARLSSGDQVRSKEGHFTVRLTDTSPEVPRKGENTWTLRLVDEAGQSLKDATLTNVVPFMPEHNHDGRFAPELSAGDKPGTFVVERINLWMGGRWEVRVSGLVSGVEDVAVLEACIED